MSEGRVSPNPFCPGCRLFAVQHPEMLAMVSAGEATSPEAAAREDGTYNPENGHFLCMECYIGAGMPSSPDGWTCP